MSEFRVKEERQLEVHGGLIGEYRKGLFETVSNFAVKPVGLVRDSVNGYVWIAVFPKKRMKTRFFVPSSDYTRPSRFAAHLQEQYPYQVVLTADRQLWQRFITSMVDIFEESPTFQRMKFVRNLGLQSNNFNEEDPTTVSFCFGEKNLNYMGQPEKHPKNIFFPHLSATTGINYRSQPSLQKLDITFGGKEALKQYFKILVPGNEIQSILALGAAMSSFYGQVIRAVHGQVPIIVLLSEEKGLGKTSCMQSVLWATSRLNQAFNNTSSAEYILSKASTTTLLIGLDDTSSVAKEEKIFVSVFDRATYGTKAEGAKESLAEFIISTNNIHRTERLADRCLFLLFKKRDGGSSSQEEKNEAFARFNSVVSDKKPSPIDYCSSHTPYIYSDLYKSRLNHNMKLVQEVLECKPRTARSYAFALNFVDLLYDEFPGEFISLGITRQDIDTFLKNDMLPAVKELHAEPEDHHKVISRWLRGLLRQAEDWTLSDCLSRFRMIKSQKCHPPGPALAIINDDQIIAPEDDLSIQMLGRLVSAHGGVRSHDAMLKRSDVEADYVRRQENGVNRKCTIVPLALIKSDLWIALCISKYTITYVKQRIIYNLFLSKFQRLELKNGSVTPTWTLRAASRMSWNQQGYQTATTIQGRVSPLTYRVSRQLARWATIPSSGTTTTVDRVPKKWPRLYLKQLMTST